MAKRKSVGGSAAVAGPAPSESADDASRRPARAYTKRPKVPKAARRPEVSPEVIARLMALSPERPRLTMGDVIHRLKRLAPTLPGAPRSTPTRPSR